MAASATIRPAGALLVGASVAMVVTLGIAAQGASAAVCGEPRSSGETTSASRQSVEQLFARITDVARRWQKPGPWRTATGPAALLKTDREYTLSGPSHIALPATPAAGIRWDCPRASLIDLPPPAPAVAPA